MEIGIEKYTILEMKCRKQLNGKNRATNSRKIKIS